MKPTKPMPLKRRPAKRLGPDQGILFPELNPRQQRGSRRLSQGRRRNSRPLQNKALTGIIAGCNDAPASIIGANQPEKTRAIQTFPEKKSRPSDSRVRDARAQDEALTHGA